MIRSVTLIVFSFFAFFSTVSSAGMDLQVIKDNIDSSKESALIVGSMVIQLVVSFVAILIIIKIFRRSVMNDEVVKGNSNVAAFVEHKQFTLSPNTRYGSSYNRQKYHKENQVYVDLYTHAEFVEFSARLHEREVEFLKRQKVDSELTEHQKANIDDQIDKADKLIVEFENEQEDIEILLQYLYPQQKDFDLDWQDFEVEDKEDVRLLWPSRSYDICCPHGIPEADYCVDCEERY